ncbi:hypothetical protein BJ170DRAFT_354318 [Xylariales sp. AK1849]|nr:hypothetical protein BJ170DRAFT_354318 [Xylariales sp. AK1849]
MSSTTGLSRSRSLRKPASSGSQLSQKDATSAGNDVRNMSPSRLPQVKPLTRSGTTTTATSAAAQARAPSSTTGRPLSGLFSGKTALTRRPSPTTERAATATARPPGRALSTRQPPISASANASRREPSTAARPTSSGGLPSSTASRPRTLGHSRAKSTATTLTAATTLRPPASHADSSNPASTTTTTTSTKPRTRSQTLSRNLSQSSTQQAAPAFTHRPAFNTNQQHYSPLKSHAPKPLTSTYLAPPSPSKLPSNVAISAETSRLQTELLQLSLLHREAAAVSQQWHSSAKRKLGARFGDLVQQNDELGQAERDGIESRNTAVLARWGEEGSIGLDEKIQVLDQVLNGVWSFGESGGRYSRVLSGFQDWADRMAGIIAAQRGGQVDELISGDGVLFLSELDTTWKADCAGLVRKLDSWRRMLKNLGSAPDGQEGDRGQKPSLIRVLEGCGSLVHDMLAELAIMEQMEREARMAELQWIEKMNEELRLDNDTQDNEVPLWKLVT